MRNCDHFVCPDCGRDIYSFPPQDPPPTLCGACLHLREFVADPDERDELRSRMLMRGLVP